MCLPIEVWGLIFSFLHLNDVIEAYATCKDFYRETRKNKFFTKKFSDTKRLYRNERIDDYYYDSILFSSHQFSTNMKFCCEKFIVRFFRFASGITYFCL